MGNGPAKLTSSSSCCSNRSGFSRQLVNRCGQDGSIDSRNCVQNLAILQQKDTMYWVEVTMNECHGFLSYLIKNKYRLTVSLKFLQSFDMLAVGLYGNRTG